MRRHELISKFQSIENEDHFDALLALLKFKKKVFSTSQLQLMASEKETFYKTQFKKKKDDSVREILYPIGDLKTAQQIIAYLLKKIWVPHPKSYGYVKGKTIKSNANCHVGGKILYNIDLKDFFPSIGREKIVNALEFKPFSFIKEKRNLGQLIADLVTIFDENKGKNILPQGAPTSPIISNIVCFRMDKRLEGLAKRFNSNYSRYSDDISFSADYNPFRKSTFRAELHSILQEEGFSVNKTKEQVFQPRERKVVTGLVVNQKVNISRTYKNNIEYYLFVWEKHGLEKAIKTAGTPTDSANAFYNKMQGKINYIGFIKGKDDPVYVKMKKKYNVLKLIEKDKHKMLVNLTKALVRSLLSELDCDLKNNNEDEILLKIKQKLKETDIRLEGEKIDFFLHEEISQWKKVGKSQIAPSLPEHAPDGDATEEDGVVENAGEVRDPRTPRDTTMIQDYPHSTSDYEVKKLRDNAENEEFVFYDESVESIEQAYQAIMRNEGYAKSDSLVIDPFAISPIGGKKILHYRVSALIGGSYVTLGVIKTPIEITPDNPLSNYKSKDYDNFETIVYPRGIVYGEGVRGFEMSAQINRVLKEAGITKYKVEEIFIYTERHKDQTTLPKDFAYDFHHGRPYMHIKHGPKKQWHYIVALDRAPIREKDPNFSFVQPIIDFNEKLTKLDSTLGNVFGIDEIKARIGEDNFNIILGYANQETLDTKITTQEGGKEEAISYHKLFMILLTSLNNVDRSSIPAINTLVEELNKEENKEIKERLIEIRDLLMTKADKLIIPTPSNVKDEDITRRTFTSDTDLAIEEGSVSRAAVDDIDSDTNIDDAVKVKLKEVLRLNGLEDYKSRGLVLVRKGGHRLGGEKPTFELRYVGGVRTEYGEAATEHQVLIKFPIRVSDATKGDMQIAEIASVEIFKAGTERIRGGDNNTRIYNSLGKNDLQIKMEDIINDPDSDTNLAEKLSRGKTAYEDGPAVKVFKDLTFANKYIKVSAEEVGLPTGNNEEYENIRLVLAEYNQSAGTEIPVSFKSNTPTMKVLYSVKDGNEWIDKEMLISKIQGLNLFQEALHSNRVMWNISLAEIRSLYNAVRFGTDGKNIPAGIEDYKKINNADTKRRAESAMAKLEYRGTGVSPISIHSTVDIRELIKRVVEEDTAPKAPPADSGSGEGGNNSPGSASSDRLDNNTSENKEENNELNSDDSDVLDLINFTINYTREDDEKYFSYSTPAEASSEILIDEEEMFQAAKRIIPNITREELKLLTTEEIRNMVGREVKGFYKGHLVYLSFQRKAGISHINLHVLRHELFHKVFKEGVPQNVREEALDKVSTYSEYTSYLRKYGLQDSLTNREEWLASRFENYNISRIRTGVSAIDSVLDWLVQLYNSVKRLFNYNTRDVDRLLNKIDKGHYLAVFNKVTLGFWPFFLKQLVCVYFGGIVPVDFGLNCATESITARRLCITMGIGGGGVPSSATKCLGTL